MQLTKTAARLGSLTIIRCSWCGEIIPNVTSRARFCKGGKCQRASMMFYIKVMTPPDDWIRCDYCKQLFPVWEKIERNRKKVVREGKRYCSMSHRAKGVAKGIPRVQKSQGMSINQKWPGDEFINRSVNCFKKDGLIQLRCTKYNECEFKECSGFEFAKERKLGHNEQQRYVI